MSFSSPPCTVLINLVNLYITDGLVHVLSVLSPLIAVKMSELPLTVLKTVVFFLASLTVDQSEGFDVDNTI